MGLESLNIKSISGLGILDSYRDVSVLTGIFIVNIFSISQNLYMKWWVAYGLLFCFIKYPLCLACKFFWKTEIVIRSRPTLFSKSHIFQMVPGWLFEGFHSQRNRRPGPCEKSIGAKNTESVLDHERSAHSCDASHEWPIENFYLFIHMSRSIMCQKTWSRSLRINFGRFINFSSVNGIAAVCTMSTRSGGRATGIVLKRRWFSLSRIPRFPYE
jgi:hypothetical protein